MKLEFHQQIFRKKKRRFLKTRPDGAELFYADVRTDSRFIANLRTRLNRDAFSIVRGPQAAAWRVSQFVCDTDCTCYSHINHGEDAQH